MNRVVLLLGALLLASNSMAMPEQNFPFGRIVNGEATTIEDHPYQVSIQTVKGSHFCGGSLIESDIVVTAAHCVKSYSASEIQVRLGATNRNEGGELVSVQSLKYHEGYNSKLMINDVALIKLSSPVQLTSSLKTIELAKETPATGTPAVVTGWGTTCYLWCSSTPELLKVSVELVQETDCASETYKYGDSILPTMVCAYTKGNDACQGDSGGPLVANNQLVGIVSWGNSCAKEDYPGVYSDVASLREWIVATAAEL